MVQTGRQAGEESCEYANSGGAEPHAATNTSLPGLSLQGNRQRVFYRCIREIKTQALAPRSSTKKMLETVRNDVADTFGRYVTDADIWKAAAAKDILP
jgi:hypothetical protein